MSDPLSPVILNKVAAIPTSAVKSIQRGVSAGSLSDGLVINIAPINPAKVVIIISPSFVPNEGRWEPMVTAVSASSFTVSKSTHYSGGSASPNQFNWQVVEYY